MYHPISLFSRSSALALFVWACLSMDISGQTTTDLANDRRIFEASEDVLTLENQPINNIQSAWRNLRTLEVSVAGKIAALRQQPIAKRNNELLAKYQKLHGDAVSLDRSSRQHIIGDISTRMATVVRELGPKPNQAASDAALRKLKNFKALAKEILAADTADNRPESELGSDQALIDRIIAEMEPLDIVHANWNTTGSLLSAERPRAIVNCSKKVAPLNGVTTTGRGTGRYHVYSEICWMAKHAGKIGFAGGRVRIEFIRRNAGLHFIGSESNGVKTTTDQKLFDGYKFIDLPR